MIPLATTVTLPQPVTLDLRLASGPRRRIIAPGVSVPATIADDAEHVPVWREFEEFPLHLTVDGHAREIYAQLPPLPHRLTLYGPEDFAAAASDTMEDHAARVLHILGNEPAAGLQALIDGGEMPPRPPRVPRSIRAWQGRAVLREMGLLDNVQALVDQLNDPAVTEAWEARENLARRGRTVLGMAAALGLSDAQVDALFVAAEALEV